MGGWNHVIEAQAAIETSAWTVTATEYTNLVVNKSEEMEKLDTHVLCSGDTLSIDFTSGNFSYSSDNDYAVLVYHNVIGNDQYYTGDKTSNQLTGTVKITKTQGVVSYQLPTHEELCETLSSSKDATLRTKANNKFLFWYGYAGNGVIDLYPDYIDTADIEGISIDIASSNKNFMDAGDTNQFTATMVVNDFKDQFDHVVPRIEIKGKQYDWKIIGNSSDDTMITSESKLTLGADEKSYEIAVNATYEEKGINRFKINLSLQSGSLWNFSDKSVPVSYLDDVSNAYYFYLDKNDNEVPPYLTHSGVENYRYKLKPSEKYRYSNFDSYLYQDKNGQYYTYYYNENIITNQTRVRVSRIANHMYSDSGCTKIAKGEDLILYSSGSKVKDDSSYAINGKRDYSQQIYYTNIKPEKATYEKNKKEVTVEGKLLIGLTTSDTKPTVLNGKFTDNWQVRWEP